MPALRADGTRLTVGRYAGAGRRRALGTRERAHAGRAEEPGVADDLRRVLHGPGGGRIERLEVAAPGLSSVDVDPVVAARSFDAPP